MKGLHEMRPANLLILKQTFLLNASPPLAHGGNGSSRSSLVLQKCLVLSLSIYNQESLITMPREQVGKVALGAKSTAESCDSSPSSGAGVLRPRNLESDLGSDFVSITR